MDQVLLKVHSTKISQDFPRFLKISLNFTRFYKISQDYTKHPKSWKASNNLTMKEKYDFIITTIFNVKQNCF